MHLDMMMLVHALLHATAVAVIGFFVLFAAGKADGIVKAVGMLLGWWIWIIAVGLIVCAVACPGMGPKGMGWMHDHMGMHGDATTPPAPMAAPAKPDAAPAAAPPAPKKP